jgi:hypothetical protein
LKVVSRLEGVPEIAVTNFFDSVDLAELAPQGIVAVLVGWCRKCFPNSRAVIVGMRPAWLFLDLVGGLESLPAQPS